MVDDPFASDEFELKGSPLEEALNNAVKKADPKMPSDVKKDILDAIKTLQKGAPGDSTEFEFPNAKVAKIFADEFNKGQEILSAIAQGNKVVFLYPKTMQVPLSNPKWDDPLEDKVGQAVCDALKGYDPQIKLKTEKGLPTPTVQTATAFFANFIIQVKSEGITWKPGGDYLKVQLAFEDLKLAQAVLDKVKPLIEREVGMKIPFELVGATLILGKDAPKVANLNFQ